MLLRNRAQKPDQCSEYDTGSVLMSRMVIELRSKNENEILKNGSGVNTVLK